MSGNRYAMGTLLLLVGLVLLYLALTPKGRAVWSVLTSTAGLSSKEGGGGGFSSGGGAGGGGGGGGAD